MSILKNIGAPNKSTVGSLGDIYIDTKTGDEYKCMFAYRDSLLASFNYSWKKIKNGDRPILDVTNKPVNEVHNEDIRNIMNEPIDTPEPEQVKAPKPEKRNYANAYKQKHK